MTPLLSSNSKVPESSLGGDEGLLEGLEGVVGFAAEGGFVDHRVSVAGLIWDVPPTPSILLKIFETNEIGPDLGLELRLGV